MDERLWSDENLEELASIQEILDSGYEQLDGFVKWLEERLEVDTRTTQQDCFNAESLVDFLANTHQKPATGANEFELRWFVFSHYIRRAMADSATEERLLTSLQRFYEYLRTEDAFLVPRWVYDVLDEGEYYLARRRKYAELDSEDELRWQEGFREWSEELEDDLDTRCLWLPRDIGIGMAWGDSMGWKEATLHADANRLWQEERAYLLLQGLDYEDIRSRLVESYLVWLDTPQDKLEMSTPHEVIFDERQERGEQEEDESEDEDWKRREN